MLSVSDALFIVFAVLTLLPAVLVVLNRNPVNSAMFMIVSFVGLAGLFVLLEAFFLAALQVVVYAGAVMVLFLFIIMLIEVETPKRPRPQTLSIVASVIALLLLMTGSVYLIQEEAGHVGDPVEAAEFPTVIVPEAPTTALSTEDEAYVLQVESEAASLQAMTYARSIRGYGAGLFSKYMLPFQVTGFLLLIAMIGVIVISRKYDPEAKPTKKRSPMLGS
ncbi:MAG: NADH-quinone oxidoreductase subunit J [Opitutales bacterium]